MIEVVEIGTTPQGRQFTLLIARNRKRGLNAYKAWLVEVTDNPLTSFRSLPSNFSTKKRAIAAATKRFQDYCVFEQERDALRYAEEQIVKHDPERDQ